MSRYSVILLFCFEVTCGISQQVGIKPHTLKKKRNCFEEVAASLF